MDHSLFIVIPTLGHFDFAMRAVRSAIEHTKARPFVVVIDDASEDWAHGTELLAAIHNEYPGKMGWCHFSERGGLLRSWNCGLSMAICAGCSHACVTNSDVLFSPGWDVALRGALEAGYSLVGPVTNAPGTELQQNVALHLDGHSYTVSDNPTAVAATAKNLYDFHGNHCYRGPINGFCMLAKTDCWSRYSHNKEEDHVFRPHNTLDSKGRPNPDPLNCLGEYELQGRWRAAGLLVGYCPGSYVVHYRSVTRGENHKTTGWFRPTE